MRNFILPLVLLIPFFTAYCQKAEPIFALQEDSVLYEELSREFKKVNGIFARKKMDSLLLVRDAIWSRSFLGYRYNYVPNQTYFQYEDLKNGSLDPLEVTSLSISDYQGEDLPEEVYACSNLKELELVNTSIKRISKKLNGLKQLWYLSILNNDLHGDHLVLKKNNHITYLKIRSNQPNELPGNFKKFKALDSLDLIRNLMTAFPTIHRNKNLHQLTVSENSITLERDKIKKNKSLRNLILRQNKIRTVPKSFGKYKNLEKLNLSYNYITAIDDGVGNLKSLKELSLYQNKLEEIPTAIFKLENLSIIDLYFNKIKRVPNEIGDLKNLEILYLSNNTLYILPDRLGELKKLKELYVHHNQLSYFPESIGGLFSLQIIRFNNNDFMTFPGQLKDLKNLENIDFSRNKVSQLTVSFDDLAHLKILVMVENPWKNKDEITEMAEKLRRKGVTVHLDSFTNPLDDVDE